MWSPLFFDDAKQGPKPTAHKGLVDSLSVLSISENSLASSSLWSVPAQPVSAKPIEEIYSACLRPLEPSVNLAVVAQQLGESGVCFVAHEQNYNTKALYVHLRRPVGEVLSKVTLESFQVKPQNVLVYTLRGSVSEIQLHQVLNFYAASHDTMNLAFVHHATSSLVVFEEAGDKVAEKVPEHYVVSLTFLEDSCPFAEAPKKVEVRVRGEKASSLSLSALKQTLAKQSGTQDVRIDNAWRTISVKPSNLSEILPTWERVLETMRTTSLPHKSSHSGVLLFQKERPDLPLVGVFEMQMIEGRPGVAKGYQTAELVEKVLTELGFEGSLQKSAQVVSFDLGGMKCKSCSREMLKALFQSGHPEYPSVSLNMLRSVLLISCFDEDVCRRHVIAVLRGLGMSVAPRMEGCQPTVTLDECELYSSMVRSSRTIQPQSGSTNVLEFRLPPDSVRCPSCAALIRLTLLNTLPALRNAVVNTEQSTLMVEYAIDQITESAIMEKLIAMGYPAVFNDHGKQLLPALYGLLANRAADQPSGPEVKFPQEVVGEVVTTSPAVPAVPDVELIASCQAKMYVGYNKQAQLDAVLAVSATVDPNGVQVRPGMPTKIYSLFLQANLPGMENTDPNSLIRIESVFAPLVFEHRYTIWYDKVVDRSKPNAPESTLVQLDHFETLQGLWKVWRRMELLRLQEGAVIMVFRHDIAPDIHDAANKTGGRWYTRALPLETRMKLWTSVVLAMVGGSLQDNTNNEVSGVVLSVKPGGDRIEVWVDGGHFHRLQHGHEVVPLHRQLSTTMGDLLAQVLKLNQGRHRLHYWTHEAYERHRKLHSGSARRDKRKHKMALANQLARSGQNPTPSE